RGPDPEREGQDREEREARAPRHLPAGVGEVLADVAPPLAPGEVAVASLGDPPALPPRVFEVAELAERLLPRALGIEAALHVLARAHLEVERQLVVHLAVGRRLPEREEASLAHGRLRPGGARGTPRPRTRPRLWSRARAGRGRRGSTGRTSRGG